MKTLTSALVLAALLLGGCPDNDYGAEFPHFYDITSAPAAIRKAAEAVVRVGTATESGTGSFISNDGKLLTNNHVLGADVCPLEGCFIDITFDHQRGKPVQDPKPVFAVPLHVDVGMDMCIAQIYDAPPVQGGHMLSTPDFLTIVPVEAQNLVGERVTIVGHPQAKLKKWTDGVVIDATGLWFETTNYILPGDSGSPVLDDKGNVVGLIHRGSASADLLTLDSVNLSALGTASAALVKAQDAPLPNVMVSVNASYPAATVIANNSIYLNAHVSKANVDGTFTDIVSLLATACDTGLARTDYTSPEDLSGGLSPCYAAQGWINCNRDQNGAIPVGSVCPDDNARLAWSNRYQAMSQRSYDLNGQLDFGSITYGVAALNPSGPDGHMQGAINLQLALNQYMPLRDFNLAPYLASFEIDLDQTSDFIVHYKKVPHYEIYASQIVSAALWLNFNMALPGKQTWTLLHALADDPDVDTGTKLYIEDVRYNSGDL